MNPQEEGRKNGRADFRLSIRLDVAWYGTASANSYVREYALGYRAGWLEVHRDQLAVSA
jgi:hypothetical protein